MNAFVRVEFYSPGTLEKHTSEAIVFGESEQDLMTEVMKYFGRDNVTEIKFFFPENWDSNVVEVEEMVESKFFDELWGKM